MAKKEEKEVKQPQLPNRDDHYWDVESISLRFTTFSYCKHILEDKN